MVASDPSRSPGQITFRGREERTSDDRPEARRTELPVRNTGSRMVQVGSHYHFFETNPVLGFDRESAYGKRLDLPPGTRRHFPPGETRDVVLVPIGGDGVVRSFYGAVNGPIDECTPSEALDRLRERVHEPIAGPPDTDGGE